MIARRMVMNSDGRQVTIVSRWFTLPGGGNINGEWVNQPRPSGWWGLVSASHQCDDGNAVTNGVLCTCYCYYYLAALHWPSPCFSLCISVLDLSLSHSTHQRRQLSYISYDELQLFNNQSVLTHHPTGPLLSRPQTPSR